MRDDHVTLHRAMRITRLSEGVDASGTITRDALTRTYDVLSEFRRSMDEFAVDRGLLVATSAVRDAANGESFLDEARRRTRVDCSLLSGRQEASFTYNGATADLEDVDEPTLVVDIGGGSTELALLFEGSMQSYSMQLGCVRVSERVLGHEIVSAGAAAAARAMIESELDRAWRAVPALDAVYGRVRLVGVAGTVATLAQMDAGLVAYDRAVVHHRRLTRDVVGWWRDRLGALTSTDRLALAGMVRGREDVLVAGLFVLDAVMDRLGVHELLSSESDILDGIAESLW